MPLVPRPPPRHTAAIPGGLGAFVSGPSQLGRRGVQPARSPMKHSKARHVRHVLRVRSRFSKMSSVTSRTKNLRRGMRHNVTYDSGCWGPQGRTLLGALSGSPGAIANPQALVLFYYFLFYLFYYFNVAPSDFKHGSQSLASPTVRPH